MKRTLLDMVQNILSAMNGDEVNSIGDSVEALQVAEEVKTAYEILLQEYDLGYRHASVKLEPSNNPDRPTHMKLPDNIVQVFWVRYNNTADGPAEWRPVQYLDPEAFVQRAIGIANQDRVKAVTDFNGTPLYVFANQTPRYYTSFDEQWLIFDGYNDNVDTTLQSSKTLCWASVMPQFLMEDDFIPDLRPDLFPRLLSEAKSASFINLKQVSNSKEEQRSRRMITNLQNRRARIKQKQSNSRAPNDYSRP